MKITENPWRDIPKQAPFWLPCDEPYIEYFNKVTTDSFKIRENSFPEPYLGNPEAPVVLLLVNPGGGDVDKDVPTPPEIKDALRREYESSVPMPSHLHLSSETKTTGRAWWNGICKSLERDVGPDLLHSRILSIEFSAYHSKSFGHGGLRLPSQQFSFAMVRSAIGRGATIVGVRGKRHWCGAIPELGGYSKCHWATNPVLLPSHEEIFPIRTST